MKSILSASADLSQTPQTKGAELVIWRARTARNLDDQPSGFIKTRSLDSALMQEEIFGPLLPVVPYKIFTEAIALYQCEKQAACALYFLAKMPAVTKQIIRDTSSGGICVNDVLVHISNPKLPFGGVGTSGMGSCHGHYGFKAFSHERSVVFQSGPNLTRLIYPPYRTKQWVLKWLKKLF